MPKPQNVIIKMCNFVSLHLLKIYKVYIQIYNCFPKLLLSVYTASKSLECIILYYWNNYKIL